MRDGAERLARELVRLGLTHVFGLPGTQSVPLFEGFRRSSLRTVLATHELNAAFMAVGFYRACGRPAVVASIPGPGFTHALSGLIEARHDSAALLHLVGTPPPRSQRRFQLQAVDQAAFGHLETKGVFEVASLDTVERTAADAVRHACAGEPGPVVLHVSPAVLTGWAPAPVESVTAIGGSPTDEPGLAAAADFLRRSRRPVILAGQGAVAASDEVVGLAEALQAPVATSCSGRGVIPEDHPLALAFDPMRCSTAVLNEMLESADCIVVLGYKLSHNGTAGFRLRLPATRLVHVDTGPEVLGANYPAAHPVVADVRIAARRLREAVADAASREGWPTAAIADWRRRLAANADDDTPEPHISGISPPHPRRFFELLREVLPRDAIVVTDSGLHQTLARRHYPVYAPRGLITPSDYQSMGFGVPAAIGAKLGAPDRSVVAIVGDGGFAMTGMELLTAVRERVPLTVFVFNDGCLNLIRLQQVGASGRATTVALHNPDFEWMARAIGAAYRRFHGPDALDGLGEPAAEGVTIVEVPLGDSPAMRRHEYAGLLRASARRALGPRLARAVKRWLGRS